VSWGGDKAFGARGFAPQRRDGPAEAPAHAPSMPSRLSAVIVLVRFFFAKSSFLMSRQISTTMASLWSALALISRMCPFSSYAM
jgi:hypothetical protein